MDVLQFSGGKDSLACLYLLKPQWDNLIVVWMNAGAPWPQTVAQMEKIRAIVPRFIEVRANVLEQNKVQGIPADVIPLTHTLFGQTIHGKTATTIQSWRQCCGENVWAPMNKKMKELNPGTIYRGQRKDERYTTLLASGSQVDGIRYIFPIEDWTEEQVDDYLKKNKIEIPEYYQHSDKSLDCWHCTAYLDERLRQIHWLKKIDPEKFAFVAGNLRKIRMAVESKLDLLHAAA